MAGGNDDTPGRLSSQDFIHVQFTPAALSVINAHLLDPARRGVLVIVGLLLLSVPPHAAGTLAGLML